MNKLPSQKKLVKIIKSNTWWSEETPCGYLYSLAAWRAFIQQSKLYKKHLSIAFITFAKDFLFERTSEQEKLAEFRFILSEFKKSPKRILSHYSIFKSLNQKLIKDGDYFLIHKKKLSNVDLAKSLQSIYNGYTNCFTYSVMCESADIYSQYYLLADLRRVASGLADQQLAHYAITLSSAARLSFMEEERMQFLKIILNGKRDFNKLANNFYWVLNNYWAAKKLTPVYFQKEAKKLFSARRSGKLLQEFINLRHKSKRHALEIKKIERSLKIPGDLKITFKLLRLMSHWIDDRKQMALRAVSYLEEMCVEISHRTGIGVDWLKYYFPEELQMLLKKGIKVSMDELRLRRTFSLYIISKRGKGYREEIIYGREAKKLHRLLTSSNTNQEIRGFVASAPVNKIIGKVQVIINPHIEKFKTGSILVTSMTRPDFVPFMRRAKAIITDEGGITSHAAIISREMGIPCIIGTKFASKVLKTGDSVTINTKAGTVKKIR